MISLRCVQDVEDFVAMSTSRPFRISLDDGKHWVNGKSFMEMFCLTLTRPLRVTAFCDEEAFCDFFQDAQRFLAK